MIVTLRVPRWSLIAVIAIQAPSICVMPWYGLAHNMAALSQITPESIDGALALLFGIPVLYVFVSTYVS